MPAPADLSAGAGIISGAKLNNARPCPALLLSSLFLASYMTGAFIAST